jgi:hypothetical protein
MNIIEKKIGTEKVESINQDSASENVDEKTGTAEDRADMLRMGKVQELRVWIFHKWFHSCLMTDHFVAKLSLRVYMGLLHDLGRILGMLFGVSIEER